MNLAANVADIELKLLADAIFQRYGFDFREYAPASFRRRVEKRMRQEGLATISALQDRVLHDAACMDRLLADISINVTSMFRDPTFFAAFREKVVPFLRTYPFIRIWHAGCSTGEEVYSLAILLEEEGLYDRCRIYATDMSAKVLTIAREAVYPLASIRDFTANYQKALGRRSFSDYYTALYDSAVLNADLKRHILFAEHNLAGDGVFNEFHAIICRNVMIYFNRPLQDRVHRLFLDSLARLGYLALGRKESMKSSPHESEYETIDANERIYRRRP